MTLVPLVLAEVADKEPSALILLGVGLMSALISLALVSWKKWLAVVAVLFAVFSAALLLDGVRSPDVGPALISELGYSYVAIAYTSAVSPFAVIAFLLFRKKKEPNQPPEPMPLA